MTVAMVRHVTDSDIRYDALMFVCPGCQDFSTTGLHMLPISDTQGKRPQWTWNGSLEAPTLEPSVMTKWGSQVCHSYLRNGVFEYLGDCTHQYAGQHIPLPDLPEWIEHSSDD